MSGPSPSAPRISAMGVSRVEGRLLRAGALLGAILSMAFEGGFRGCGTETTSPPGALPMGPTLECVSDSDCEAPLCMDAECVAGRCQTSEVRTDADSDGAVGAPCGPDCDDRNSAVAPGAFEACDGVDNDCDGTIDDGAPATVQTYDVAASIQAAVGGEDLPGVLFFSTSALGGTFVLEARWLDLAVPSRFAIGRVAEVPGNDAIVAVLSTGVGARVFWSSPSERTLRETSVEVSYTDTTVTLDIAPPTALLEDVSVEQLAVAEAPSGPVLLLDVLDATMSMRERMLFAPGSMPVPLPYSGAPFDLAARDTRLYTPTSPAALAVVDASGTELGQVMMPAAFGGDAVTGWNGRIFTVVEDFSDFAIREIGPGDVLGDGWPISTAAFGPDVELHPLANSLALTRNGFSGLELVVYDASIAEVEASRAVISGNAFPYRTVVDTSVGVAVIATRDTSGGGPPTSAVATVACQRR